MQIPLRHKYTTRKVVKQVSAKGGGNTASLTRNRHKYLPTVKTPPVQAPTRTTLVLDAGSGKRRWARD